MKCHCCGGLEGKRRTVSVICDLCWQRIFKADFDDFVDEGSTMRTLKGTGTDPMFEVIPGNEL